MSDAPHSAVDFIIKNAPKYGKAKGHRVQIEEFRKSKKALLMKDALSNGFEAANAQEREAYADPEYIQLISGLAVAVDRTWAGGGDEIVGRDREDSSAAVVGALSMDRPRGLLGCGASAD